ncbi:MAG: flagellar basal body L-ring protein FlgH [Magnetococcales bacterium]|nr:flagellar basal body L-ring protein FlgH [Magnetococcales bacterium]
MTTDRLVIVLLMVSVTLTGCGMTRASQRPIAPMAVVQPEAPERLSPKKGSIWQTTDRNTLFVDNKARNIGDLITVYVSEESEAGKEASTALSREDDSSFSFSGLFDLTSVFKSDKTLASGGTSSKHEFDGSGKTERESAFTATISCQVTEMLSNGNLRIEGRRDITINNENQFILLSGIIRPEDIATDNSIQSAQIADARIEYSGDGDIDDQQNPGWVNSFFANLPIL